MARNDAEIRLTATDATRQAFASAAANLRNLETASGSLTSKLGLLAGPAGLGVGAGAIMLAFAKNAISSAAALDDLAEATGGTVEGMSALVDTARISGTGLETVQNIVLNLQKALLNPSADENKGVGAALKQLNLDAAELLKQDPAERIKTVAKALAQFADDGGKAAVIQTIFKKSAAEAAPFLKDVADNLERGASVTAAQAAEAEKLEKQWRSLALEAENLAKRGVLGLVEAYKELKEVGFSQFLAGAGSPNDPVALQARIEKLKGDILYIQRTVEDAHEVERQVAPLIAEQLALQEKLNRARAAEPAKKKLDPTGLTGDDEEKPKEAERKAEAARKKALADRLALAQQALGDPRFATTPELAGDIEAQFEAADKARKKLADVREEYLQLIDPARKAAQEFRAFQKIAPSLGMTAEEIERIGDTLREKIDVAEFGDKLKDVARSGKGAFGDLTDAINGWSRNAAQAFADFAFGAKTSIGDLLTSIAKQFVAMQAQKVIFDPLFSSIGSAIGSLFSFHGGGIVGQEGTSGRSVSALAFAVAPRFHGGLMPGEMPAILQRGEGVFTPGQMRALGGARVEINVINNAGAQVRTQEREQGDSRVIDVLIEQVDGLLARNVSRGSGALSTAMERTFGLNRAAGAVR